jgi:Protein of unknown function (DUF2384)
LSRAVKRDFSGTPDLSGLSEWEKALWALDQMKLDLDRINSAIVADLIKYGDVRMPSAAPAEKERKARISKLAEKVFGDRDKAERWLGTSKRTLGGKTPLSYLTDEAGERTIQNMLYQIDYGVFS